MVLPRLVAAVPAGPAADAIAKTAAAKKLFSGIDFGVAPSDFAAAKQSEEKLVVVGLNALANPVLADLLPTNRVCWVHSLTTGLDWMDKSLAGLFEKHNVPLSNARGCYSVPLAEHVIMSVLYFNRSVARLHSLRRAREWNRFPSPSTTNQRMVIVGYGDIAREVARVATQGMRMSIVGVRASATEESVDDLGTRVVPSSAMQKELAEADFVCLVLPKTPATHHLFNAEMIALLKPSCVVINIGRGSTVDEAALSEALHAGRIKGAALDVFDVEPLPASSPLWDLSDDRVLITSHNADITPDLWELASAQFMRFADKFVSENELPQYTTSLTRGY